MDEQDQQTQNPQPQPALQQPQAQQGSVKKILIVDDEEDARELFVDMLSTNSSYEISTAVDGVEALTKAEAIKFDLVLLDIIMPRKDGVQTLSEIKASPEKYGTPKVLMLTNIGGDIAVEEAMKLGAVGFKTKINTEPEELINTVAALVN